VRKIEDKIKLLEEKEKAMAENNKKAEVNIAAAKSRIALNVGGKKFETTKATLLKQDTSLFATILGSDEWKPDEDGSYFIDRNPKYMPLLLDYLRSDKLNITKLSAEQIAGVTKEAEFYNIKIKSIQMGYESKIVSNFCWDLLKKWTGKKQPKLLYQASRDGFLAANFHSNCDNMTNTLTIIKENGKPNIMGGFLEAKYAANSGWILDPKAFIFTLVNPNNIPPTTFKIANSNNAAYSHMNQHVYFGDFVVAPVSSAGASCTVSFPQYYTDTQGRGFQTFAALQTFSVGEIEVYSLS